MICRQVFYRNRPLNSFIFNFFASATGKDIALRCPRRVQQRRNSASRSRNLQLTLSRHRHALSPSGANPNDCEPIAQIVTGIIEH
jgi:hypothetical protein